jgi:hypothetical protein
MISMPTIQIQQRYAQIGIDADLGAFHISQPIATFEINTTPAKLDAQYRQGTLRIDQSKAWDALAVGSNLNLMQRIYSEAKNIALQGTARIVENGNRMAAIQNDTNAFAEIAAG